MSARFDLAAAWGSMSPDTQRRLGMAAIAQEIGYLGCNAMIAARDGTITAYDAAQQAGSDTINAIVARHCLDANGTAAPPDLAPLGIRQCESCGCTDRCGCSEGCSWVGPLRCSACVQTA